ncbi:MAG: response regulator [Myxococcales bacterium]|nr:response regulator [Myxococcales bacterium]
MIELPPEGTTALSRLLHLGVCEEDGEAERTVKRIINTVALAASLCALTVCSLLIARGDLDALLLHGVIGVSGACTLLWMRAGRRIAAARWVFFGSNLSVLSVELAHGAGTATVVLFATSVMPFLLLTHAERRERWAWVVVSVVVFALALALQWIEPAPLLWSARDSAPRISVIIIAFTYTLLFGVIAFAFSRVEVVRAQLVAAAEQAKAASKIKSEFLTNVSHELRTPLASILGYTDLLRRSTDAGDDRLEHLRTIRRNSQHLLDLINDLLDITKIEADELDYELVDCAPTAVLADIGALMQERALECRLGFKVAARTRLPRVIKTDPRRVRQILINLVSNAIKFTDAGRVVVTGALRARGGALELVFEVADTGCGLAEKDLEIIFEPFVQVDASTQRRRQGSGLGLAISRQLAHLLGGSMEVESVLDVGSKFRLVLPVPEGVELGDILAQSTIESSDSPIFTDSDPTHLLGVRVLVVDDSEDIQQLIRFYLERVGAKVEAASDGLQALRAVERERYDLVLLDMQMPHLDGYETARELRGRGFDRPIVALTAHALRGERTRCLEVGCDDYLSKPFTPFELIDAIGARVESERRLQSGAARRRPQVERRRVEGERRPQPVRVMSPRPRVEGVADASAAPPRAGSPALEQEIARLRERFRGTLAGHLGRLREACAGEEWSTAQQIAHTLKGSAGCFGLSEVSERARALEQALKDGRSGEASTLLERLEAAC